MFIRLGDRLGLALIDVVLVVGVAPGFLQAVLVCKACEWIYGSICSVLFVIALYGFWRAFVSVLVVLIQ